MRAIQIIFITLTLLSSGNMMGQTINPEINPGINPEINPEVNPEINDHPKPVAALKRSIIPVTLIGLGIIVNHSDFEKDLQTSLRNKVGNDYEFRIDDYLQYVPIVEMYASDLLGVKAMNHWFDQTKYLLISNLISASITQSLKFITQKERPTGAPYSFPSGHTTFAFTNATVLYDEFKETSPLLAYSGYAFAATTGSFRMINNKHWLSDVLAGAGIGIVSAELVYYFEPFQHFNPFVKTKNIAFIPQIGSNNVGFYFAYHF